MFRSTKGASKQRRDLINNEISNLRDLLPLPESARQRLSQLQIMSLSCCYIRKCNYFTRLFGNGGAFASETPFQFSQAMNGFLLITTREGKLLYISENITEYLGHSMVDMMTQGDSLYDIIDKRDHSTVQSQLLQSGYGSPTATSPHAGQQQALPSSSTSSGTPSPQEERTFFCRMNVARSFRRQAGFGDHKMMHVRGHFIQPLLRDHYGNQPVFMAICSPLVTPDVKETAVQTNTMIYQSVHGLDLKFIEIGHVGEHHLGYDESEMFGKSLYELLHPEDVHEAKEKHMQLIKSSHEMGCMLTVRLQNKTGVWVWVNMVMHIRQPYVCDNSEPAIICINHVIQESEAQHFKLQSQLYSSHIAPSPEYLAQGASPPHTITQVSVEQEQYQMPGPSFMGALQSSSMDEPGTYYGAIGVTVTPAEGPGSGRMTGNGNGVEGIHLQHTHSQGSSLGSCSDSEVNVNGSHMERPTPSSPQTPKQMQRADILNKLKRKMTEHAMQQCKPAKSPRMGSSPDHQNGGLLAGNFAPVHYSASVMTGPSIYALGGAGSVSMGDVQVMAPIQHAPMYADLALKNEIKVEAGRPLPQIQVHNPEISQPLTPPSPNHSTTSESSNDMMTSLTIDVDMNDTAVVPSSMLTPDSSPASSPTETVSPVGNQELSSSFGPAAPLDELSFFDNLDTEKETKIKTEERSREEAPRVVQQNHQKTLPMLDVQSLEDFLSSMETPKPLHPQLAHSPTPAMQPTAEAIRAKKLLPSRPAVPQEQLIRCAVADQLLGLSDDQLMRFMTDAIQEMKSPLATQADAEVVHGRFVMVPQQSLSTVDMSPASAGSSHGSSTGVEVYDMEGQSMSPSDGDFMDELHQLTEDLVNSPSYGEEELAGPLFNQTL